MPITPNKIDMKIANKNKTVDLASGEQVNVINAPGLTTVAIDLLFPGAELPFANYAGGYKTPNYYLGFLDNLKSGNQPFQFIVTRTDSRGSIQWDTNLTVTIEDYKVVEDSRNGADIAVAIDLKQYRAYGSKIISISEDGETVTILQDNRIKPAVAVATYTVQAGDTLFRIARTILGDDSKITALAEMNGIIEPNNLTEGQILRLA